MPRKNYRTEEEPSPSKSVVKRSPKKVKEVEPMPVLETRAPEKVNRKKRPSKTAY